MRHAEDKLHAEIVRALEVILPPSVVWWSSESRGVGVREGARRKARGVKAGVPDMQFHFDSRSHFIEIKTTQGRMNEAQIAMAAWLRGAGHQYDVCRSLDDVIDCLRRAGCPMRIARIAA